MAKRFFKPKSKVRKRSSKSSRLARSQKGHDRMLKKWRAKGNSDVSRCYGNYHAAVYNVQSGERRILTSKEKRSIFNYCKKIDIEKKNVPIPDVAKGY